MPLYEYQCAKCQHVFEELVRGEQTVACPRCASKKTQRLMSRCRAVVGGFSPGFADAPASSKGGRKGGCAGCSGGNCATC